MWASLERRISDAENKVSNLQHDYQRDLTQLLGEVREVTHRVNGGLSNSVGEVKVDNVKIKLEISELYHTLDKAVLEMKSSMRESTDLTKLMVSNFEEHKLTPVEKELDLMKKTIIYGLVGAVIVFLGQKGINIAWDKVFADKPRITASAPAQGKR